MYILNPKSKEKVIQIKQILIILQKIFIIFFYIIKFQFEKHMLLAYAFFYSYYDICRFNYLFLYIY